MEIIVTVRRNPDDNNHWHAALSDLMASRKVYSNYPTGLSPHSVATYMVGEHLELSGDQQDRLNEVRQEVTLLGVSKNGTYIFEFSE